MFPRSAYMPVRAAVTHGRYRQPVEQFAGLHGIRNGRDDSVGQRENPAQCRKPVNFIEDVKVFSASLSVPYCGVNSGFEAAQWLEEPASAMSLAMIPLRNVLNTVPNTVPNTGGNTGAFGLLVLASPDATRYTADMGTEFLMRIGEVASAGLSRLLPPA